MNEENTTQEPSVAPYNLDNDPKTPGSTPFLAIAVGGSLMMALIVWLTLGWHTALLVSILCFLVLLYHLATSSEMSPFRIHYLIDEAKNQIIQEPRLYTQDDMAQAGVPTRDWSSASGAYVELDGVSKEIQLVFASPVSRPVGRFWSKPKSLLWTISGYGSDFTLQEGLISETGRSYWVEQYYFTDSGSRVLRLVQGTWNHETHEFVGDYVDSNGTMGSYPTMVKQK